MRCLNAPLKAAEPVCSSSKRRHHDRCRVAVVTRVAQERPDAATSPAPRSSSDRVGIAAAADASSSSQHAAATAGAAAVVSGFGGLPDAQQQHNGLMLQGLSLHSDLQQLDTAAAAAGGGSDASDAPQQQQQPATSSSASSSSSSGGPDDLSYIRSSQTGWQRWADQVDSSSSGSGHGGLQVGSQPAWEPPSYRRSGLRLRSKRLMQAAEKMQRDGRDLISEELQSMLSDTTYTSSSAAGSTADTHDEYLEAFIDQMLCPKTSLWRRAEAAPAGKVDGREAIDPDVLANIHTAPQKQVWQEQMRLAKQGQLLGALLLLEEAAAAGRRDVLLATGHKPFLRAAGKYRDTAAVLRFMQLLPAEFADAATYNMALKACADCRDLRAALRVVDIMGIRQVPTDFLHFTTLIAVCASAGDANQAFAVFQKAKAAEQQLAAAAAAAAAAAGADASRQQSAARAAPKMDGQVYGALIAACAQAIRLRSSDLREQLVILERAFQVLQEAETAGVYLETPVWNALLMCAGRCRQLQRCFEVLDRMTAAGVPSDSITYTCLIEAAVLAGDTDMAQRVFARAMATGVTNSVQLYTAAINACMSGENTNFDAAFEIYSTMQRNGVEPDDLLFGHLIAIAGRCRKLEVAFDLLEDMRASGLAPSTPTCSALIYACLQNNNFAAARKVYDTLVARGVAPHISQYNALMEQYALRFQLGNVVSVLTNMVAGGVQPNANTFRILLLACHRTDQAELAFELYQIMKARGLLPRLNNAHSICYTLLSACFKRIRKSWWPGGYPPKPAASMGPYSNLPGLRPAEARQLLHVLQPGAFQASKGSSSSSGGASAAAGGSSSGGSARQQQHGRRFMFLDNADNINWPALALSTYRDFIGWGYKPHLEVLDRLLACLRLQLPKAPQRPAAELQQRALQLQAQLQAMPHPDTLGDIAAVPAAAGLADAGAQDGGSSSSSIGGQQHQGQWLATAALLRDLASQQRALSAEERPYEVPFDKRAIDAVGDAISMGLLPAFKLDRPLTVDMRGFPPCVAEAYVHMLMSTLESRAATAAAEGKRQPVAQRIRLIVPPFDHNYVMWPSYVEKLYVHYNEQLLARQAQLRAEAMAARQRAAALAAQNMVGVEDDEDLDSSQLLLTFGHPAAAGSAGELRQGMQPSAAAAAAAMGRGRGRAALTMSRSWDTADFGDDLFGADFTGYTSALASSQPGVATAAHGCYIAGAVTGLAAAATFRRLKAYTRVDSAAGAIKLETSEINRWLMAKLRFEEERRRLARDAEIAAAGYSTTLPFYQQQQQQAAAMLLQQQQGQQPTAWPAAAGPHQQQQQQQPLMGQLGQQPYNLQQQQQQPHAGDAPASGMQEVAPAAAGSAHMAPSTGTVRGYGSSWGHQQHQIQQQMLPGLGLQGRGMSNLRQQARDIRLGMASTGPASVGLNRPNRAGPSAPPQPPQPQQQQQGQQQQGQKQQGQQQQQGQQPPVQAAGSEGNIGSSSSGGSRGNNRVRKVNGPAAATARDAASGSSEPHPSISRAEQ